MKSEIEVFSPMRGKKALSQMGTLGKQAYDDIGSPVSTVRGIVGRDNNDIMRCDVMFAYFLDTTAVSIGSMAEFGLAYAYRKPIVTVMTPNNIHNHIFTQGMSTYITEDIDEAIYLTKMLLEPGLH
jgi:nucleoside 2-deoxyribosyltransferase